MNKETTFEIGIKFLQRNNLFHLENNIREKIFSYLMNDLSKGELYMGKVRYSVFEQDLIRLFPAFPDYYIDEVVQCLETQLYSGNLHKQTFAIRILNGLKEAIPDQYIPSLMEGVVRAILLNTDFLEIDELKQAIETYPDYWISTFAEILIGYQKSYDGNKIYWLQFILNNPYLSLRIQQLIEDSIGL